MNLCVIIGRMAADPEIRTTQSGVSVTSFRLAVDRDYAAKGKERETDWIDCVAWRE
ncbi:MAG TPA: single-stranded DNA-binding protein, partial [Clostridia bacterium]|nr:single-stranded DNA-binding protein [Clostridia bacterium]